ncbi:hypothetical protein BST61_g8191 [Cercospora zeina]
MHLLVAFIKQKKTSLHPGATSLALSGKQDETTGCPLARASSVATQQPLWRRRQTRGHRSQNNALVTLRHVAASICNASFALTVARGTPMDSMSVL